ncbi:MAG: BLUF domain-containing protein [Burkholderiaceae bacterium]|nr:MAG: BLUF domain-containing protein [Burkholderiaceae bacterium]
MPDLHSLAYISKNTIQGTADHVREALRAIIATAERNNPRLGVTGALLYSGGYFCQVIEGPQEALEELFESIQMDKRHGEVTVLHFEPITEREFSEWAMALAGVEEHMRFDLEGLRQSKNELVMKEAGRHLVSVLEELVQQRQAVLPRTHA